MRPFSHVQVAAWFNLAIIAATVGHVLPDIINFRVGGHCGGPLGRPAGGRIVVGPWGRPRLLVTPVKRAAGHVLMLMGGGTRPQYGLLHSRTQP